MSIESLGQKEVASPVKELSQVGIEMILNHPDFEGNYRQATNIAAKYAIAVGLIKDGRYEDPLFLLRSFIPQDQPIGLEEQLITINETKQLKESLALLLMQKGIIDPDSKDAKEAESAVSRTIDRDENLKRAREVLPIHVMGALTNALMFENVGDEKRKEKLRSWTTRALLKPYLADLTINSSKGADIELRDLVLLIPEKIFQNADAATLNIMRNYFVNQALRLFIEGEQQGFQALQKVAEEENSQVRRDFLGEIIKEFDEVRDTPISPRFKDSVEGWFEEKSPFPLFRQKYFAHEFRKTRRLLLNGDTGATKTACGYLATVECERATIFGPAKARNTWPKEAEKIFKSEDKPDVFTIQSSRDLENQRIETAQYVYVGTELLGRAWNDPELYNRVKVALVDRRQTDGVIYDESDEFRKDSANRSKVIKSLVAQMRDSHQKKDPLGMPMVALTATPISSSLSDLDITIALLYPERFTLPKSYEERKHTFSHQALKDPKIAFSLLFGERLMMQWTLEDLFGEKAPKLEPQRKNIEKSPYENVLYEWVSNLQTGTLTKIRLLRSLLLNPELIKKTCTERSLIPQPLYDQKGLEDRLRELHEAWTNWLMEKNPAIPEEPFSANWIAKYGDSDFLIQCFFDNKLVNGVDSLVQKFPNILLDWKAKQDVSEKYKELRKFLQARAQFENGQITQGFTPEEKVFIVVPYHKKGVTRNLEDPNTKDEDLDDNALSLYEYLLHEWLPGLPKDMSINIDGSRSFYFRDNVASNWRMFGKKFAFVVADMDSVDESMDWASRDTEENKNIKKINVIFPFWPWGYDEFKQMSGRFLRPGQSKPVDFYIYESENSIDHGFYDLVRLKFLLTQMALAGVELNKEDQEFFRSATQAKKILLVEPRVGQAFLRDVVRKLKGSGEQESIEELSKQQDGKSNFELFAKFYFDEGRDEFRTAGNNAEMVKNIILRSEPRRILSLGAGTCIFARKVIESGRDAEIDNIDINGAALRLAKERFPQIGNILIERASKLSSQGETYDAVDCSFMLPWTKLFSENGKINQDVNEIERVKILTEINRVQKVGAEAVLSFPESAFDASTFSRFVNALISHFGYQVKEPSGISYATDCKPNKRIGWVITLQKTDNPNLSGLNPTALTFSNEGVIISRYKNKKDTEPVVIKTEYPIFSSKEFIVHNPITNEISSANSADVEKIIYVSPRAIVAEIKQGLSESQWNIWRAARRDIERVLGRTYEDAEEVLVGFIRRKGLDKLSEWNTDAIQRIVDSEINRLLRKNRN